MELLHLLFVFLNIESVFSLINFDLTHSIKSTNPIFPGLTPFNFTQTYTSWGLDGDTNESYFKALNTFITGEHFGTHIDAPYHGSNASWSVEQIPFERLVSIQALIVDVSKKSLRNRNYEIQIEDLNEDAMQQANGFYVLLFYTGKSKFWPDQITYTGGELREELEFPGLSVQLASYLVNKYSDKLVGVGIDTLSIDPGSSKDFRAHRILFKENIYVLENVAELHRVLTYLSNRRETLFSLDVLPMKIEGGTGAPCRIVARLENIDDAGGEWFGFLIFCLLLMLIGIAAKEIYGFKFHPDKNFS
ncbi:unnamed protein product [Rotaria magnacalcarata]|uniref:Kynurenine formamidase n=1 Tax=Rotaria magnacalcarata TaxID=392030 RepID=A0A815APA1_9BILA|nr:unnamed protein product [Rotaria magnacalcarata]CAF1258389.1 unnamed protein product [Rotaria magnacalcarata]CAF1919863.1 unnamed protein product [Rotaria magnacalcarata]CAF2121525.1 unnamed protein product [Rotaria magnacalcarata]CAF2154446.1 unnamed protein product [Rotaria magnacalcarata]